jgi:hypothetical protein
MRYGQHYNEDVLRYDMTNGLAEQRIACCDCSLTHDFTFELTPDGKTLEVQIVANPHATANLRRSKAGLEALRALFRKMRGRLWPNRR